MGRCTVIASVLCALLTIALLISYHLDPRKACLELKPDVHVGVLGGDLWFCSTEVPYHGSIIGMGGYLPVPGESALDLPGVYYRYFRSPLDTVWSLGIHLLYLILPLAAFPTVWFVRRCIAERSRRKEPMGRHDAHEGGRG